MADGSARACDRQTPHRVECDPPGQEDAAIDVFLGRGDDRLTVGRRVPNGISGHGSDGDDVLRGGPAYGDSLSGNDGTDVVHGGGSDDSVSAGGGRGDRVYGDAGDDSVMIGGGPEPSRAASAYGGPGNDGLGADASRAKLLDCGPGELDQVSLDSENESPIRGCEQVLAYEPFAGRVNPR
jgi:hypothetical protein